MSIEEGRWTRTETLATLDPSRSWCYRVMAPLDTSGSRDVGQTLHRSSAPTVRTAGLNGTEFAASCPGHLLPSEVLVANAQSCHTIGDRTSDTTIHICAALTTLEVVL